MKKLLYISVLLLGTGMGIKAQKLFSGSLCGANAAYTSTTPVCFPGCISFTDASTTSAGYITNWYWNFGDDSTSTLQNPAHCYVTAGKYIVTLKITTNLACVDSVTDTVTIYPKPSASISFTPNPPHGNFNITISDTTKDSLVVKWDWLFGDGMGLDTTINSILETYPGYGTYGVRLIVTNIYGCTDTVLNTIDFRPFAVNDISVNNIVSLYPNPNNGNFQLKITNYELGIENTVEVYNMLGELVQREKLSANSTQVEMSNKANGVYFYRVLQDNGSLIGSGKFVIQK